jgi:hypothetical protein
MLLPQAPIHRIPQQSLVHRAQESLAHMARSQVAEAAAPGLAKPAGRGGLAVFGPAAQQQMHLRRIVSGRVLLVSDGECLHAARDRVPGVDHLHTKTLQWPVGGKLAARQLQVRPALRNSPRALCRFKKPQPSSTPDPLRWRGRGRSTGHEALLPIAAPSAAVDQALLDQYFSQMVVADLSAEDE